MHKKQDVKVVVCSMLLRSKFKYVSDFMFTLLDIVYMPMECCIDKEDI